MQPAAICSAGLAALMASGVALADAKDVMAKYVLTTNEGYRQRFRLYVPENYDPSRSYPVIIYLSGSGENGTDNTSQLAHINPIINHVSQHDEFAAFVIAPQAKPNSGGFETFTDGRAIPMTMQAMDLLGKEFNFDTNRLYLTGLSQGGIGTWRTAAHYQNTFAAIAPVAGMNHSNLASQLVNTPVWAFHGASDTVLSPNYTRDTIKAIQNAGGRPLYTEYYGMGHWDQTWAKVYNERSLYEWMFNQTLTGPIVSPPPLAPADPQRSFSDGFDGPILDPKLEDAAGNYVVVNGRLQHTDVNTQRTYIRTHQTDLNTQDFIFEVTVNLQQGAGGNGITFVGFGPGDPIGGSFDEPTTSLAVRMMPPDFAGGNANLHLLGSQIADFGTYGGGRHRIQLIKEGDWLTINLDRDYNGELFFTDSTFILDLSTVDTFTDLNSRVFFGTASDLTSFDDMMLHVFASGVPIPEPTVGLLGLPMVLLLRRRRCMKTAECLGELIPCQE